MKSQVTHPVVVCTLPEVVAALIALGLVIVQKMTDNKATFPSPSLALAQVTTDLNALSTSEMAVKNKTASVEARDEKKHVVITDLHLLRNYVQMIVSQNPEHAAVIADAAGMRLRKPNTRAQSDLVAKPHTVSGSVHLVAKAAGKRASHDWQYSLDGKSWLSAPSSVQAQTTIGNLQTGVVTYFRHRSVTKAGPADWTAPIAVLVT